MKNNEQWKKVSKQRASIDMHPNGKNAGQISELNSHVLCEQRRFWSSWPRDVAPETKGSLLSGPCWQDPRSTGVVLPWEAAVSVEQTDPAMEFHTSQDVGWPTEGAIRPKTVSSTQQGILLTFYATSVTGEGPSVCKSTLTWEKKYIHIKKTLMFYFKNIKLYKKRKSVPVFESYD